MHFFWHRSRVWIITKSLIQRALFPLVVLVWFSSTFLVLVPIWCRTHPRWCNPVLLDVCGARIPNSSELDRENAERTDAAVRALARLPSGRNRTSDSFRSLSLAMAVVTRRRPYPVSGDAPMGMRYLTQVVWKLVRFADEASEWGENAGLFVCNVDEDPDQFAEAALLSDYVTVVRKRDRAAAVNASSNLFELEKSDYAFCLRRLASMLDEDGSAILFQDDALPVDDFGPMIRSVIDQVRRRPARNFDRADRNVFVKLYHPDSFRKIPWHHLVVAYSAALASSTAAVSYWARWSGWQPRVALLFVYTTAVLWCLGHESVAYIRYVLSGGSVYLVAQESCCIPAVLYTRSAALAALDRLDERRAYRGYAVDHMLDEMTNGLMTDTNLIRHIGRYTTLRPHPVSSDPW